MQLCKECLDNKPSCLMAESDEGEEKICTDCTQTIASQNLHTLDDISEWWRLEAKNHFAKRKIMTAVDKIQNWWKKYLRSDLAKYRWVERMLDYSDNPHCTENMLKYMEKIVTELNEPSWEGTPEDYDYMSFMMNNLECAQGSHEKLPGWWNWNEIRFKTDQVIWSDYSYSSDSE
jgi:hypothetical protein